ncbi:MAG TPA: CRISPR-associated protein Csm3 [Armatimonadetes bacterium]|nr:CRISPR-associated protein Csm3 [Armatimonadota bacterium]
MAVSKPVSIGVTLVFQTPPSVAAGGAFGSIADRVVERNAKGEFIIPASQVKGKVRHACEQILRALGQEVCNSPRAETMCPNPLGGDPPCPICCIFGSPAFSSPLRFHDLVLELNGAEQIKEVITPYLRAMIGMNRRRATVAEGRLFLVETAPYFPELKFTNPQAIEGMLGSEAQVKLLLAGLKLIHTWGGMKSRGLGWIASVEVNATFDGKPVKATDWQEVKRLWSD